MVSADVFRQDLCAETSNDSSRSAQFPVRTGRTTGVRPERSTGTSLASSKPNLLGIRSAKKSTSFKTTSPHDEAAVIQADLANIDSAVVFEPIAQAMITQLRR